MRKSIFALRKLGFAMDTNAEGVLATFFEAVRSNNVDKMVELLKSKLVSVDSRDETSYDRTALHIAAKKGYYDMTRILVDEYNAPVNVTDKDGEIPLQLANDTCHMKIVKFLLKRNSNMREYAEHQLNDEITEELFEAAESNDLKKIVELLDEKKVDVNALDKSNNNQTILHVAAANGYEELARILVDKYGANVNRQDDIGDTAVAMAYDNEYPAIAEFLIKKGYKNPRPPVAESVVLSDVHTIQLENK